VVNFQSFNSYLAGVIGCTTYSFALNFGCYFPAVPWDSLPLRQNGSLLLPQEFHCHFRLRFDKSIEQPELKRGDVWLICEDGKYLAETIADASEVILGRAIPWFNQLSGFEFVLDHLMREEGATWGTGTRSSPKRHYLTGYIALAMGRRDLAAQHLQAALDSGCFKRAEQPLRETLRSLAAP
jgi:hypothetical protein